IDNVNLKGVAVAATRRANPTYYDGDLRRELIDTALELIAREGPSTVSLRSLARGLGVSHAAPGNHFPDKAALFTAIAIEGFKLLSAAIEDAVRLLDPDATAAQRFGAAGRAYTSFAVGHRAHFEVMWQRAATPPSRCCSAGSATPRRRAGPKALTSTPWPTWRGRWCTGWPRCGSAAPCSARNAPSTRSPARSAPCSAAPWPPAPPRPRPPERRDAMDSNHPTQALAGTSNPGLRIGDAERGRVVDQLADHHAAGRLTLEEFEDRMASAWTARTGADLDVLVQDLPAQPGLSRPATTATRRRLDPHATTYLAVIALLWLVWLVTGAGYPWPIWPMLGWGIGVVGHHRRQSGTTVREREPLGLRHGEGSRPLHMDRGA